MKYLLISVTLVIGLITEVFAHNIDQHRPENVSDQKWNELKSVLQETKLLPILEDRYINYNFGYSVSLFGDRALIGVPGHVDNDITTPVGVGAAYIYDFDGSAWVLSQVLTASNAVSRNDDFGISVSLGENRALIGARGARSAPNLESGAAYIFEYDGSQWIESQILIANDGKDGDRFGGSVSLSGDRALIGAVGVEFPDEGILRKTGVAYLFEFNGSFWNQRQRFKLDKLEFAFGRSVSLVGNKALIGAYASAFLFEYDGTPFTSWAQTQKFETDFSTNFSYGYPVSLNESGDRVFIGNSSDFDNGNRSGAVYVYDFDGQNWPESQKLAPDDGNENEFFGISISQFGDSAIIGKLGSTRSGTAYVFELIDGMWAQIRKLNANDSEDGDSFASAISMFGDQVLIGARFDNETGTDNGSAYIMNVDGLDINQGISGAWYYPETSGSGLMIDIRPEDSFIFLGWFSHDTSDVQRPSDDNGTRWYTASGIYNGGTAQLDMYETRGGLFDDSQTVTTTKVGTFSLDFDSCKSGQVTYEFDNNSGQEGNFPIQRAVPGTESLCESLSGSSINSEQGPELKIAAKSDFTISQGLSSSWYYPETEGSGLFLDIRAADQFIFAAWFTHDHDDSNQATSDNGTRWFTASGTFTGDMATLDLYETKGGLFDDPQTVTTTAVGSITFSFSNCKEGNVTYEFIDSSGLKGSFPIQRGVPGTESLCEINEQ